MALLRLILRISLAGRAWGGTPAEIIRIGDSVAMVWRFGSFRIGEDLVPRV